LSLAAFGPCDLKMTGHYLE